MEETLDKALDIAKRLRKHAQPGSSPEIQRLVTDLTLSLADLKVEHARLQVALVTRQSRIAGPGRQQVGQVVTRTATAHHRQPQADVNPTVNTASSPHWHGLPSHLARELAQSPTEAEQSDVDQVDQEPVDYDSAPDSLALNALTGGNGNSSS